MEAIIDTLNVQEKTKTGYKQRVRRIEKSGFIIPLDDDENIDKVKEYIDTIDKCNSKMDLLNIMIVLRKKLEKPITEITKLRDDIRKLTLLNNVETMNKRRELVTDYDTFLLELNKAYEQKQYNKFIINFLWFNYGVRNEDVNVTIVTKLKDTNDTDNFLVLQKDKVKYIRNKYKTFSTYGQKKIDIVDINFVNACKKVKGKLLDTTLVGNALKKYQILNMTERDIFNIIIDKFYKDKDTLKINELSSYRGTSINNIKAYYDMNATEEIIREL
jgi:hypothetical protein